jgi:4,5-DOPA dioxygenase extradiol
MNTLPAVFVSHGAPTFALEPGLAGQQLAALGAALGKPRAVVILSPHWMPAGVRITTSSSPETIHDFGGFAPELYAIQYPAPGSPEVASLVARALKTAGIPCELDDQRGLDHGAWVPLMHMYPNADVPVVQVSIPFHATELDALALGQALAPLSNQGVLIIGSGSLTHNLYEFRTGDVQEAAYVREFTSWIRQAVGGADTQALVDAMSLAPHARRAHPTLDHYLPLLIAAGAASDPLPVTVLDGGVRYGILAMESYVFGRQLDLAAESPATVAA